MASLTVVAVGPLKEQYYRDAVNEYKKRLSSSWTVNEVEVKEEKLSAAPSPSEIAQALEHEGDRILAALPKRSFVVALCVEGEQFDSVGFSKMIEDAKVGGASSVCFVVGSAHGLSGRVKAAADVRASMSRMTFPHTLARVMLFEAVYRALTIARGTGYHK